jgi:MoaA/NifB/PqqE/SkfB family radical SAM enzyme
MRAHPTSRRFPVHDFAELGMMIQISSNGSRLDQSRALDILTRRRPYRLTLSIYGATEATYDGMTRRRGSFRRFMRGSTPPTKRNFPCGSTSLYPVGMSTK